MKYCIKERLSERRNAQRDKSIRNAGQIYNDRVARRFSLFSFCSLRQRS